MILYYLFSTRIVSGLFLPWSAQLSVTIVKHCFGMVRELGIYLRGRRTVTYNNCCKGGKVYIPPYKPRPEPLSTLACFDGEATIKKIHAEHKRQYNYLFSFTFFLETRETPLRPNPAST
jgi:hypothetical protein